MNILQYENFQEQKVHVQPDFPYNTYLCSIPLDFSYVPIHWHDEIEIIYIKKGRGFISVDLTSTMVEAGTLALILPGQLHSIAQYGQDTMEYENIIFHTSLLFSKQADMCSSQFLKPLFDFELSVPTFITPELPDYEQLAACINEADEICKTFPTAYPFALKSQLFQFFYLLLSRHCAHTQNQLPKKRTFNKMKQIIKYIENHYMEKITIADIAAEAGMSQSHFMKYFKNTMGTSFIDYLNEYRLTMASRMLLASSDSILNIAAEAGFDNISYFNRLFKKRFGTTPRAFRKK